MRKIIALALLFVLSIANFAQKITIQGQKESAKPTPLETVKATPQKTRSKTGVQTKKTVAKKPKTKPKTPVKAQKTTAKKAVKPKTEIKPKIEAKAKAEVKPKPDAKTKTEAKPKKEEAPKIATVEAKTADGQDITLRADGTWAYKKPEPTPVTSPAAKPSAAASPVAKLSVAPPVVARATPTPSPKPEAKPSPKDAPVANTKPSPTPKTCQMTLAEAPSIRGLRLGMTRDEADRIIPRNRVTIVDSSDIVSYPRTGSAGGFENVYQISAAFAENRLSSLGIIYDPENVKWKSVREFAATLSENFSLAPVYWKYDARSRTTAEMQCRDFAIMINSEANEITLRQTSAGQKPALDTEAQKKVFRP